MEEQDEQGALELLRSQLQRIRYLLTRFSLGRWEELSRSELYLAYPVILVGQVFRELLRDRGLVRASSLAFTTVLSVVPVLTVATSLLAAFKTKDTTLLELFSGLLPGSANGVVEPIMTFVKNQGNALSGIGSVVLILLGITLFNNIEQAFNDIWRIRKSRGLLSKFLTFYALITLAPLMITISIIESARVQLVFNEIPFVAAVGYKLLPVGLAFVTFTVANKLLPYTEVRWLPALVSGLVTALAFELAKYGFNIYVETILEPTYATVYGAIGLIPIFLVWVYVSWLIVLFGAEMTYTIQNLRTLLLPERLHAMDNERRDNFNPLLAIEVMAPLAESFKHAHGPMSLDLVAAHAGLHPEVTAQVLDRLVQDRLVLEIESVDNTQAARYIPARPLEDISLLDVLNAARRSDVPHEPPAALQSLHRLHRAGEEELMGELTCLSLVDEEDPARLKMFARSLTGVSRSVSTVARHEEKMRESLTARISGQLHAISEKSGEGGGAIDALAGLASTKKPAKE